MKAVFVFIVFSFCVANSSFAQTANKAIEQAILDPKRVENAGKADVLPLHKTRISDSNTVARDSVVSKKRSRTISRKKKS